MLQADQRADTEVVVGGSKALPSRWSKRSLFLLVGLVVLVGGGILWYILASSGNNSKFNQTDQKLLEASVNSSLSNNNFQGVVGSTRQLISGAQSGQFTISNSALSQYYLDEASAYLNLKQYNQAVPAFEAAQNLNSSNTTAALQGELNARYYAGQREQLIPILEQLEQLSKASNYDPLSPTAAQYQDDITAIQHGQEITVE